MSAKYYHFIFATFRMNHIPQIRYTETSNMVSDKKLTILNDGSTSNETRLGAVADIQFALNSVDRWLTELTGDHAVLVIAGDTLFFQDFKLEEFIRYISIIH